MLQNNTEMTDQSGRVSFDKTVSSGGGSISPGEEALNFYTQFARSGSLNYTWNPRMHYSIDAFSEGSVAMMFNYSWHARTIKDKAPKLNFSVASVPQFENGVKVNFANYWGFAVAKNKTATDQSAQNSGTAPVTNEIRAREAWNFLTYLTIKPDGTFSAASGGVGRETSADFDPAKSYLSKTGEPAARRDLIEQQKNDPVIGVFAADNLIARSWRQSDPSSVENIFAEMIDTVNKGQSTVHEAVQTAAQRVRNL
jgi:ABC-type glycerol-3-phosphate transport system substrate-binding protein